MKKVISVLLCALMLLALIPTSIFAANEPTYTMWGHNILQSYIRENNYGKTVPGDDYAVKPIARYKQLYAAIEAAKPSIIALQECDMGWHYLIDDYDNYLSGAKEGDEQYGVKPFSALGYKSPFENSDYRVEGIRTPIYYDTSIFTLVDAGIFTYSVWGSKSEHGKYYECAFCAPWAVLKVKATGEKVAVTSTHVGAGDGNVGNRATAAKELMPFIKEIETKYNCPVISMGDYNANPYEESSQVYATNMNFARYTAKEVVRGELQTHNGLKQKPAKSDAKGTGQIDHCFYTNGIAAEKWELVFETGAKDENGKDIFSYTYADHTAHRLTFRILGSAHKHTYGAFEQHDGENHKRACTECYLYEYTPHTYSTTYVAEEGGDKHGRECTVCGYIQYEAHSAPTGEKVDDNTHKGLCPVCNTVGISAHVYTYTQKDEEHCIGTCQCGHTRDKAHQYTYTSNGNGENDTHKAICPCGDTRDLAHVWDAGVTTKPATYKGTGTYTYTCTLCSETRDTKLAKLDKPESQYDLGAAGQKTYYVGAETTRAPKIDGKITKGEYSLELTGMEPDNDLYDDRFFFTLKTGYENDVSDFNIYVSHDKDYIYLAAAVTDFEASNYGDSIHFYIGDTEDTNKLHDFYIPRYTKGGVEAWLYDNLPKPTAPEAEKLALNYIKDKSTTVNGNDIVYEVAFDKAKLGIENMEKIFFAALATTYNKENVSTGEVYFAFKTEGLSEYAAFKSNIYPHVLVFDAEPEPETTPADEVTAEPETEAPVVTETPETEAPETEAPAESGCGSSVAAVGVALVMTLGSCTAFIRKRK